MARPTPGLLTLGSLTTRGRCLLAAGFAAALCALLLNERDLLRIATFAVALPLLAALVTGRTRIGLRAAREVLPPRIPVGSSCEVTLAVRSTGWLGGQLWIADEIPPVLGSQPHFVLERSVRRGTTRLHYTLRPAQRGVYSLGPLVAQITDPFALVAGRRQLTGHSRLVVTPVVVPLTGILAGEGLDTREEGGGPQRGGPGADAVVVRSYRHGDDLRKVHWRLSARHDELIVRVEERHCSSGSAVLLDHRAAAHRGAGPTSSLEYAVSLAASVCVHLQRCGHRVRLVTTDGRVLTGGTDVPDTADVGLDALAALRPTDRQDLLCGPAMTGAGQVIAVFGAATPAMIEPLLRHRAPSMRRYAVVLDVAAWSASQGHESGGPAAGEVDPAQTARTLVAAGWTVAVARPELPAWSVWERLRINSRGRYGALR